MEEESRKERSAEMMSDIDKMINYLKSVIHGYEKILKENYSAYDGIILSSVVLVKSILAEAKKIKKQSGEGI